MFLFKNPYVTEKVICPLFSDTTVNTNISPEYGNYLLFPSLQLVHKFKITFSGRIRGEA